MTIHYDMYLTLRAYRQECPLIVKILLQNRILEFIKNENR